MVKYSFDFKQNIVQEYLSGQGGIRFLTEKYGVKSARDVRKWINAYKQFGSSGLQRKRRNMAYSPQFKLNTVNLYLTSEKSYQEVANEVGINNPSLISQWVTHYRDKGEFAFSDPRGRPRKEPDLPLENKKTSELSDTEQKLSKLQEENLRLRIENEYLKGLRRLRLERQAKENPDLFKTSTDDSSSPSK